MAMHSTIRATGGPIGSRCTLAITKKNSNHTHSVRIRPHKDSPWLYVDAAGNLSQKETVFGQTLVHFTIPESFYQAIPNSQTGTAQVQCWTYTEPGIYMQEPAETGFTYYAVEQDCRPDLSCRVVDTNEKTLAFTGDQEIIIRYLSHVRCSAAALTKLGASASPENIAVSYLNTWHYGPVAEFSAVETDTFQFWAKDSRGFEVYQTYTVPTAKYVPYVLLTNQTQAKRLTPTGDQVLLSISGDCYPQPICNKDNTPRVSYSLNGGDWVALKPTVEGNRYSAQVVLEDLPYDRSYYLQTRVEDLLETVTKTMTVEPGLPVFDWGREDMAFHVPVTAPAVNGTKLQSFRVWNTTFFRFQSRFTDDTGNGGSRQSLLLFGNRNGLPVLGVILVSNNGTCTFSGTEGISLTAGKTGEVTVNLGAHAFDWFTLVSADDFTVL